MAINIITASTSKLRIPMPELTEDGRVLPPCTVKSFPVPHPDWKIQQEKELSDLLPKSLPTVPGVSGNRSTACLHLEFKQFVPKESLSELQAHLQTATNIQKALRTALIHPAVEQSLLPTPTSDHHPGLVTVEDLRCLTKDDHGALSKNGVEFFYLVLCEHLLSGSVKSQQYLLSCLVFGWYPSHFCQKKLSQAMYKDLTLLADRILKFDDKSTTFQSSKSLTMCPFVDCFHMCSSQYAAVKHAMREHYHTWVVCGICLCRFAPSLSMNVSPGWGLITLKEHILLCGSPAGSSMEEAPPKEVPPARSSPVSVLGSVGTLDDNANAEGDDADGVNDNRGAVQSSRKRNLAAVLGGDADSGDDDETEQASKRRNLVAVLRGEDKSKETCPSKWLRKAKK